MIGKDRLAQKKNAGICALTSLIVKLPILLKVNVSCPGQPRRLHSIATMLLCGLKGGSNKCPIAHYKHRKRRKQEINATDENHRALIPPDTNNKNTYNIHKSF
jgi:hypothetical protein